jgi:uncharacterized protein (TIGR03067 family)
MNRLIPSVVFWLLVGMYPGLSAGAPDKGRGPLEGTWVVTSVSWCGKVRALPGGGKPIVWSFSGGKYKSWIGREAGPEEGTYRVDPSKSPRHLDLTPARGEVLTTQKCLYALNGDELKIAFTLWFAPGTPKEEIERARKMRATRPKSLETRPENLTLVLTLKRQKQ